MKNEACEYQIEGTNGEENEQDDRQQSTEENDGRINGGEKNDKRDDHDISQGGSQDMMSFRGVLKTFSLMTNGTIQIQL